MSLESKNSIDPSGCFGVRQNTVTFIGKGVAIGGAILSIMAIGVSLYAHFGPHASFIGEVIKEGQYEKFLLGGIALLVLSAGSLYGFSRCQRKFVLKSTVKKKASAVITQLPMKRGTNSEGKRGSVARTDFEDKSRAGSVVVRTDQESTGSLNNSGCFIVKSERGSKYSDKSTGSFVMHSDTPGLQSLTSSMEIHAEPEKEETQLVKPSQQAPAKKLELNFDLPIEDMDKREEVEAALTEFKTTFLENAKCVQKGVSPSTTEKKDLSEQEMQILEKVVSNQYYLLNKASRKGVTVYNGGLHHVFECEGIDGWIFKIEKEDAKSSKGKKEIGKEHADAYVQRYQKAKQICEEIQKERGCLLLRIPYCFKVKVKETWVVVEQLIPDLNASYEFQRGIYRWGMEDTEAQGYFKELMIQQAIFIAKMKLADYKFDNIPIDPTGFCNLIDMDEDSAVRGLIRGNAGSEANGLLNTIPLEWLEEIMHVLKKHLTPTEFEEVFQKVNLPTTKAFLEIVKEALITKKFRNDIPCTNIELYRQILHKMLASLGIVVKDLNEEEICKLVEQIPALKDYRATFKKLIKKAREDKRAPLSEQEILQLFKPFEEEYFILVAEIIKLNKLEELCNQNIASFSIETIFSIVKNENLLEAKKIEKIARSIADRLHNRKEKRAAFKQFLQEKKINNVTQPVQAGILNTYPFEDEYVRFAAFQIVKMINEQLVKEPNCDLITGRRVMFETADLTKTKGAFALGVLFVKNKIPQALEILKEKGLIHRYKHDRMSPYLVIYC